MENVTKFIRKSINKSVRKTQKILGCEPNRRRRKRVTRSRKAVRVRRTRRQPARRPQNSRLQTKARTGSEIPFPESRDRCAIALPHRHWAEARQRASEGGLFQLFSNDHSYAPFDVVRTARSMGIECFFTSQLGESGGQKILAEAAFCKETDRAVVRVSNDLRDGSYRWRFPFAFALASIMLSSSSKGHYQFKFQHIYHPSTPSLRNAYRYAFDVLINRISLGFALSHANRDAKTLAEIFDVTEEDIRVRAAQIGFDLEEPGGR